jgi:type VI secretion system protein ImpJ
MLTENVKTETHPDTAPDARPLGEQPAMTARAVHWSEGMFLRPHHLQAAQRYQEQICRVGDKWDLNYNWGLREIEIDREALRNHRLVIISLQARMLDGTLISIPQDGALPILELKEALQQESNVTVLLAVPLWRQGRANLDSKEGDAAGRYFLDNQDLEDENTGLNPQALEVRLLNLRLLLSNQDPAGFEVLPIARLEKSSEATTAPQMTPGYIPALLACDAWPGLRIDIIQYIYNRIGAHIEELARQVLSQDIAIESQASTDVKTISQLRILNEAYALLGILANVKGRHPLEIYLELCRLVGQLSIYGDERRPPLLPLYDHDDLTHCFGQVKIHLDNLFRGIVGPKYKQRPFKGNGLRMEVKLDKEWLDLKLPIFVGVKSSLTDSESINMMTTAGRLDTKIGSSDRVDRIFRDGLYGLKFTHTLNPPSLLPRTQGVVYYQVARDSQLDEWQYVQNTYSLALRLNERNIVGTIQDQESLTIKTGPTTTATFRFTLFVLEST